jgi:NADPH:quinone reductase-like Zn-dependent oxidoreductase
MKAAAYTRYGPPDVVQIMDVEKPVPKDNEVLIKVRAASVNPADWRLMGGAPYVFRVLFRLRKPTPAEPGSSPKLCEPFVFPFLLTFYMSPGIVL